MQISSDINPRRRRDNQFFLSCFTRSASSFIFIYFTFLVLFSLFQGVFLVRLLTFFLFVALLFLLASVAYLALDSWQLEFRLPTWWCLRQPALTLYLWNPMWWLPIKFTTRLRPTTQTTWNLIWMSWRNSSESTVFLRSSAPPGGTPLYGLYRYVRPHSAVLVINRVSILADFGHKLGMGFVL